MDDVATRSRSAELREHWRAVLLLSDLMALTVVGLEPARTLALNWNQLSIDFADLALRLALSLAAVFGGLSLAAFALVSLARDRGVALLVAIYLGLWLQTSVLVWSYGPFDGTPLAWEEFSRQRNLELGIWLALCGFAAWQASFVLRHLRAITGLVFVLYLASLGEQLIGAAPYSERVQPLAPGAGLSTYSTQRNALVIVLDTLQSDFFAELLLDSEFADTVPPGFTYYRNATSYYGSTQFSLQSILTSARVPDGVHAWEFIRSEMEHSVPSRLGSLGFDAALATFAMGNMPGCKPTLGPYKCARMEELLAADAAGASENVWRADVSELLRVGLFRSAPQILKQRIRGRRSWTLPPLFPPRETPSPADPADPVDPRIDEKSRTDLLVLEKLSRELAVEEVAPRFRFLHFHLPHHPVSVDGSCAYVDRTGIEDLERWQTVAAARCILSRVFAYLEALDSAGGYDPSAIFLVADHGSHFAVDRSVARPPLPDPSGLDPGFDWTSRGLPLFLAKPREARGALQISDRPVALCDLPNSVFAALELPDRAGCSSIFAPGARSTPRRYYRYPDYFEQQKRQSSSFEFDAYGVDGHAWHVESWRPAKVQGR